MSPIATEIYNDVLTAMQNAEEMGGPEGTDYIELMERIAIEATQRANNCREVLGQRNDGK